jgi:peptidoglycan-associated lipoprotein
MKIFAAVLVSLLVAACSSAPKTLPSSDLKPAGTNGTATLPDTHGVAGSAKANEVQSASGEATANAQNAENKSVYFDFDSFAILSAYRDVVMQQADAIKKHKNGVVVLEGNADERGSRGYNLALGGKRARAVQKSLAVMGIPASKTKVVSLGKDKPRLTCHEEKCWHENRRVDFVLK